MLRFIIKTRIPTLSFASRVLSVANQCVAACRQTRCKRKGYDANAAACDDGFRGAEAHLIPDDGGEELGGEVSYIHTIATSTNGKRTMGAGFIRRRIPRTFPADSFG